MRRLKYNSLWIAITVSILLHLAFFRFVSFEREPDKQQTERYEVKLLYYKPLPEEAIKPKPKKVKKKKEVVEKQVQKRIEERPEEEKIVEQTEVMKEEEKRFEEELALASDNLEEVKEETSEIQGQEERASFDISPILEGLRRRINEKKIYPYVARKKGLQGVVFIILRLDESGNPIEVRVTQSSGHRVLDNAALSLVEKVLPYEHDLGQPFTLEIPIRYSLFE